MTIGKFFMTNATALIKFPVLLRKNVLDCYSSLEYNLRAQASLYETVHEWANTIKNGWEQTNDPHHILQPICQTTQQLKLLVWGAILWEQCNTSSPSWYAKSAVTLGLECCHIPHNLKTLNYVTIGCMCERTSLGKTI